MEGIKIIDLYLSACVSVFAHVRAHVLVSLQRLLI